MQGRAPRDNGAIDAAMHERPVQAAAYPASRTIRRVWLNEPACMR